MGSEWLDDLSEDWVSQPRSSSPQVTAKTNPLQSQHERSRIPLLRGSLGTNASPKLRSSIRSRIATSSARSALKERSNNVQLPTGPPDTNGDESSRKVSLHQSRSDLSQDSVIQEPGTTRRAASSSPKKVREETPEWKRRLLQGKTDYGDKTDLFSPIGLEKMFKQPSRDSVAARANVRRLRGLRNAQDFPSSPPPWPVHAATSQSNLDPESALSSGGERQRKVLESLREPVQNARSDASVDSSLVRNSSHNDTENGVATSSSDSFSPVFIAKHNDAIGGVEYAALDMSKTELEQRIARHYVESQSRNVSLAARSPTQQDRSGISDSLPDDLEMGTPDVVPINDFVSVRRGGHSRESSFMRKPLSPSPSRPDHDNLAEISSPFGTDRPVERDGDYSKIEASAWPPAPTPPAHATPTRIRQELQFSPSRLLSSPLKLFGPHDTFTTNRLQRRMSQLELLEGQEDGKPDTHISAPPTMTETRSQIPRSDRHVSVANRFGNGELDEHAFTSNISLEALDAQYDEELNSQSPSSTIAPPGAKEPLTFRTGSQSSEVYDTFKSKRNGRKTVTRGSLSLPKRGTNNTSQPEKIPMVVIDLPNDDSQVEEASHVADGKRPRSSPQKDRTPKRRRTLVMNEIADGVQRPSLDAMKSSHEHIQSVLGRKRKDSRPSDSLTTADATTLAGRHILRPRNPTPSQRRREEIQREIMEASELYFKSSPKLQKIREHLQTSTSTHDLSSKDDQVQARALAEEVAAFSIKVQGGMKNEGRKKSVTTQDFLDEAMKIMDFFRKGKRPTSALSNLDESQTSSAKDAERNHIDVEVSDLTLSRPPSREGQESKWRGRQLAQLDPTVEEQLKRFEDDDDEDYIASSFQSFSAVPFEGNDEFEVIEEVQQVIESDPPNLRVYENPNSRTEVLSSKVEGEPSSHGSSMPSHKSYPSVDSSVGRTTLTTASTKSAVGTLHPASVPHLLSEDTKGMRFDKEKGIWIKARELLPTKTERDISDITQSDEDPLEGIPDLTVDEAEELEMMSPNRNSIDHGLLRKFSEERQQDVLAPKTGFGRNESQFRMGELDRSDDNQASKSYQVDMEKFQNSMDSIQQPSSNAATDQESVEHEINIHEGRGSPSRANKSKRKVSQLRISFSSPLVTRQLSPKPSTAYQSIGKGAKLSRQSISPASRRQESHMLAHQLSETVEEQHEVSIVDFGDDQRRVNFSVSLSAPLTLVQQQNQISLEAQQSSPSHHTTFFMSELSEFTISHDEDEREAQTRTVVNRGPRGLATVNESRFENGNARLVGALQDAEPEELYWQELKQVVLSNRGITSLHLLDVLCDRIENLDLSDNLLAQLGGAPSALRSLSLRSNALTSLTSWNHLQNLQYVDVSNNDIDSLTGFESLIHLRELRADGNTITSLDGILGLDGLLSLSLQRNRIQFVDLQSSQLHRLQRLNLASNQLYENEEESKVLLPSLTHLCLDDNGLSIFPSTSDLQEASKLRHLSLRNNSLDIIALDAVQFPAIQNVHLDHNRLTDLSGLQSLQRLDTFSMSYQRTSLTTSACLSSITSTLPDARSILLSGTHIPHLTLPESGLHHLAKLELASCNLTELPSDFASKVPNLRSLNVSFNNIKDISPIVGLRRLETLLLNNCTVSRLRKLSTVLARIGGSLKHLDLRNNPVVAGFYDTSVNASVVGSMMVTGTGAIPAAPADETEAEDSFFVDGADNSTSAVKSSRLAPVDPVADSVYRARLSQDTALRRRVYEILMATGLARLTSLDGLPVEKGSLMRKDECWARLTELGVLKISERRGR